MIYAVMGFEPIAAAKLAAFIRPRGGDEAWAQLYADLCPVAGIRTSIAFAQACHETGYFTFPGCGQTVFSGCPEFNNPCGIKNKDGSAIAAFATQEQGVRGHLGHLVCYFATEFVHREGFCAWDPRHVTHRILENDARQLGGPGRWAPNPQYGLAVLGLAEELLAGL